MMGFIKSIRKTFLPPLLYVNRMEKAVYLPANKNVYASIFPASSTYNLLYTLLKLNLYFWISEERQGEVYQQSEKGLGKSGYFNNNK